MNKTIIFGLLIFLIFSGTGKAQQLIPMPVESGKWIQSWMLCGPIPLKVSKDPADEWDHLVGFKTDYLIKSGGEQNPKIKDGDVVCFPGGSAKWKFYQSPDSIIDLDQAVSKTDPVFAYAYSEIQSDRDKIWFVALGSNDGGSLWVNGLKVWDYPQARGLSVDNDKIPVLLKKGKNTLFLKVEERGNKWGFCLRFLPFSTKKLTETGDLFSIRTRLDGQAKIVSEFSEPVLQQLVKKLSIQIKNPKNKTVLNEELNSGFSHDLNLNSTEYQPYSAQIKVLFSGGEEFQQKLTFMPGREKIIAFADGKSGYRIVLDKNASESEQWGDE